MKNQPLLLTYPLLTLQDTQKLASFLAPLLQPTDILALTGQLGAGKTTFTRFLIQSLAPPIDEIPSPTFTLVQTYDTPKGVLWHFDCYRLATPFEAIELGIEDAFNSGISVIEWPEKIEPLLPSTSLFLTFDTSSSRSLKIFGDTNWKNRLCSSLTPLW